MTPKAAIKHFGTQTRLADALDITQPCVANWVRRGRIPSAQQLKIAKVSKLPVDQQTKRSLSPRA